MKNQKGAFGGSNLHKTKIRKVLVEKEGFAPKRVEKTVSGLNKGSAGFKILKRLSRKSVI